MKQRLLQLKFRRSWTLIVGCMLVSPITFAQVHEPVFIAGAMRNVMWKGELAGTIDLDTLQKKAVYGLGPIEGLKGEILLWDGTVYSSRVIADSQCIVSKNQALRAPFFVYVKSSNWRAVSVPDTLMDMLHLENFLNRQFERDSVPFAFRLSVTVHYAKFHIVNLPDAVKVQSPEDAHIGKQYFELQNEEVNILGFYSTQHKGVFTHHSTNLHAHLINLRMNKMGHIDQVQFIPGTLNLYVQ